MQPDCEDSDHTQTPERTPAFHNGFRPNTDKLGHILSFSQKQVRVLVPFDYVARFVINANDGPMRVTPIAHDCEKLIK